MGIVMDLCSGGDLAHLVDETFRKDLYKNKMPFSKTVLAQYAWQMLSGLDCLQRAGVVHRDIKPSNYLVESAQQGAQLKLADFGLAKYVAEGEKITGSAGTLHYMAPEVLAGSYDMRCDIWGVGATLYETCVGMPPFWGGQEEEVRKKIETGEIDWDGPHWCSRHPKPLKKLLAALLTFDPENRPWPADAIASSLWLRAYGSPRCSCIVS